VKLSFRLISAFVLLAAVAFVGACSGTAPAAAPNATEAGAPGKVTLILGAYTTPREAYGKIIPLFQKYWKDKTGQEVEVQESYLGSGAQSRAIVEGFEADIAALSLEADITRIAKAGLIKHEWNKQGKDGMVSDSIVVLAVRKGNPRGIKDWKDLTQKGLDILTPDPKTSGGAQWNVMAMWGAAERGFVDGYAKGDDNAARQFLQDVFKNVSVLDKGARESITNYEKGVGDVAITYENEVLVGQKNGQDYEYVIPHSTILIENPVAVVDTYVDKHGTRAVAEAFRDFLWTKEAQQIFAEYGLRSVDPEVAIATKGQYPEVADLFKIGDVGGWSTVTPKFFGDDGIYTKVIEEVQSEKGQ
jgi:sulfate/thiosulfate transport system substrate-binding protein